MKLLNLAAIKFKGFTVSVQRLDQKVFLSVMPTSELQHATECRVLSSARSIAKSFYSLLEYFELTKIDD